MKRVMFLCISVALAATCISQESDSNNEVKQHKWMHGFHFSVSQSQLTYDSPDHSQLAVLVEEPELSNSLGVGLGINSEYKATKHFSARVTAGLAFNGGYFTYTVSENEEPLYDRDQVFLPVTLDAGLHGILNLREDGVSPYAVFGVTSRIPIDYTDDSTEIAASNGFISADLGIGLNAPFTHFNFFPELKYSYALQGMNHVTIPEKTYMHQVSLILGLKG